MSRNQRIGLILAAVAVVVVAVVIAVSGGDDEGDDQAGQTTQSTQTQAETDTGTTATETETETETEGPPEPAVTRIRIRGGEVVGGVADIKATKGDHVRIVVSSDAPDEIHLHGYDIEKEVEPGKPVTFDFTADIEGIFEMESHTAEDAGREPQVAKLTVEPS
jgi:hypothetical protein